MTTTVSEQEARRIQRYPLALPARVEVKIDDKFSWNEITRLEDISAFGAGFQLKRPVKRGRLLTISVPMPRQLRCYDYLDGVTTTYAVGVAFIGKNPPASFVRNPAIIYELVEREDTGLWRLREAEPEPDESELPAELRRHTRFSIPETLLLELLDEKGDVVASEVTVTENLSLGGAAVFTSFAVERGSFLRVRCERQDLSIIAMVRGKRVGQDGITRLHLEFIDHLFPLEGIG
jgi:hypothetical protein